ncbi:MAG: Hydrogenase expression/formation protein HypD [Candidatus Moranbacteria bacterium GW2011_GWA2_39_41]|nr:MAG: Hydrogenase expression/formation protein HypD [Candidatus Moranbacteria bacterium GW2011_GWA2_39_41]
MKLDKQKLLQSIQEKAKEIGRPLRLMELCGTHSQSIAQHGINSLMPKNVKLVSGPGCPVCVTDQTDVDVMVGLALAGIPVAVYGDTMQVPGNLMSLEEARRNGADVNVVYDITEAIKMSQEKTGLVFFGLGFETTTGMTAWAIQQGLIVYSAHKIFPPAMSALLANKQIKVDGFINPGHVSSIIGTKVYEQFKIPQVVTGFDGEGMLSAIEMLLTQILENKAIVQNVYTDLVKKDGNPKARKLIAEVFEISDAHWRGLGEIKKSGLKIRKKYKKCDAEFVYAELIAKIKKEIKPKPSACKCGLVLQGLIESQECPLFGKVCTPDNPQGACMVSVEGSCNVEFRYNRK